MTNVGQNLLGHTTYFDKNCASFMIIYFGHKKSKDKKSYLPCDKSIWPTFYRFTECKKPQGKIYKGAQRCLTFTVEVIRSFFQDLRCC